MRFLSKAILITVLYASQLIAGESPTGLADVFERIAYAVSEITLFTDIAEELQERWFYEISFEQFNKIYELAESEYRLITTAIDLLKPKPEIANGHLLRLHQVVRELVSRLADKMEAQALDCRLKSELESKIASERGAGHGHELSVLRLEADFQRLLVLEEKESRAAHEAVLCLRRINRLIKSSVQHSVSEVAKLILTHRRAVEHLVPRLPVQETDRFIDNVLELMRRLWVDEVQQQKPGQTPSTSAVALRPGSV